MTEFVFAVNGGEYTFDAETPSEAIELADKWLTLPPRFFRWDTEDGVRFTAMTW